jgi:hypothetical protein
MQNSAGKEAAPMPDDAITEPDEIARYIATVREMYPDTALELAQPPVVVRTATGARVMAWLPIEDEDVTH